MILKRTMEESIPYQRKMMNTSHPLGPAMSRHLIRKPRVRCHLATERGQTTFLSHQSARSVHHLLSWVHRKLHLSERSHCLQACCPSQVHHLYLLKLVNSSWELLRASQKSFLNFKRSMWSLFMVPNRLCSSRSNQQKSLKRSLQNTSLGSSSLRAL